MCVRGGDIRGGGGEEVGQAGEGQRVKCVSGVGISEVGGGGEEVGQAGGGQHVKCVPGVGISGVVVSGLSGHRARGMRRTESGVCGVGGVGGWLQRGVSQRTHPSGQGGLSDLQPFCPSQAALPVEGPRQAALCQHCCSITHLLCHIHTQLIYQPAKADTCSVRSPELGLQDNVSMAQLSKPGDEWGHSGVASGSQDCAHEPCKQACKLLSMLFTTSVHIFQTHLASASTAQIDMPFTAGFYRDPRTVRTNLASKLANVQDSCGHSTSQVYTSSKRTLHLPVLLK